MGHFYLAPFTFYQISLHPELILVYNLGMPENNMTSEQSSIDSTRRLGSLPGQEIPKVPGATDMLSESSKQTMENYEKRLHEQARAGNISPSIEQSAMAVDMAGGGAPKSPEDFIRDQIEHDLAFSHERAAEGGMERVDATTFPWEARMAVRDVELDFVNAPPRMGDDWGYQKMYAFLGERAQNISKLIGSDKTRNAIGLGTEPWRDVGIISRQNIKELRAALLDAKVDPMAIEAEVARHVLEAKGRMPIMIKELLRSKDELWRVKKVFQLSWNFRNAASANEVGDMYLGAKFPMLPRTEDFAEMLQAPAYFMKDATAETLPGYPKKDDIEGFLTEMGRSKENLTLGEAVEKETRILYLVALSERPELVMQWKQKTEQEALFEKFRVAGVNPAYLVLKEKGIDYRDPIEEQKIEQVLNKLTGTQEQEIKNVWWQKLGFADEADGIAKVGDPEKWIPMKARRGEIPVGDENYFSNTFDRNTKIQQISSELATLKKLRQGLSPINNLAESDKDKIFDEIEKSTDRLRNLQTYDDGKKLTSVFQTLQLERELGLRSGVAELGCIWSIPQTTGNKDRMMVDVLAKPTEGDALAYEQAKAITELFGIQSKHGIYAVDFDPRYTNTSSGGWGTVGAEAWPYTNEFQNILAFPWYAKYKAEAGGPEGSRGRFGPLMTDYLSACVTQKYDASGNLLYIIIDKNKQIREGRADEGLILADTTETLMNVWEKGKSLGNPDLWKDINTEDPFRRWLLRGFFAEGMAVFGPSAADMIGTWKKREWKIEDLDSDKFWDGYKLSRKVTVRDELFDEDVWKDVLKGHNKDYRKKAGQVIQQVKSAPDPVVVMKKEAKMYNDWMSGRKKKIYNYSDQMFWRGVSTMQSVASLLVRTPPASAQLREETPAMVLNRIIRRAKACTVNLVGEYNKDVPESLKGK